MWALLGEVGGNVAELRRRLAAAGGASVPSASTLHRVIRRDRRAGRALLVEREPVVAGSRRPDPLSELGLSMVAGLYWLVHPGSHPDEWTAMVNEARGEWWEHYDVGCVELLVQLLAGEVRSEILSSSFPFQVHEFRASGRF